MPIKKGTPKEPVLKRKKSATAARPKSARQKKSDRLLRAVRAVSVRLARQKPPGRQRQLERHENNPILTPKPDHYWEMKATFNPGAIYADGRVHLLYRALGGDDVSVLGYAASDDGVSFSERLDQPAYIPATTRKTAAKKDRHALSPAYFSGGGWNGGCEDPRLTLIDGIVYLIYTAFDGWGSVRIALSSIELEDFLRKRWEWKKPALISPPGEVHKNWMLFPEKIHGRFAILHSITPEIMVNYYDSLDDFDDGETFLSGSMRKMEVSDRTRWESLIRGAGPPPLKTKDGWLLLYHAVDRLEAGKYKLGAMILDADDPTKVLYWSNGPILGPDFGYENEGMSPGIVYSCGAVIKDGMLYVYYGGADSVSCVAMANVDRFLDELKKNGVPKLALENNMKRRPNGKC